MSSIVLEPAVKEMLLADCRDFLRSEDWYAERAIPFRRGYLLHGVPRSGKTSLINSLAGELDLDICVLNMSSQGMSDRTLMKLIKNVPSGCLLLFEIWTPQSPAASHRLLTRRRTLMVVLT
jgi:chaperone BCS1